MIEVTELDGTPRGGVADPVHFLFKDVCESPGEWIDILRIRDGEIVLRKEQIYLRGNICLQELPPPEDDVVEADWCLSIWCDGVAPPPLDCGDE